MTPEEARIKAEAVKLCEPAHVKVMRGPGGRYDYEISYHGETMDGSINTVLAAKARLELELYGTVQKPAGGAV